jgi:hypothetical protein
MEHYGRTDTGELIGPYDTVDELNSELAASAKEKTMKLPNYKPTDPDVQRVELKVSDTQYLTVLVRPDKEHGQEISLSLFTKQDDDLDLVSCVNTYPDGTVFVVLDKDTFTDSPTKG